LKKNGKQFFLIAASLVGWVVLVSVGKHLEISWVRTLGGCVGLISFVTIASSVFYKSKESKFKKISWVLAIISPVIVIGSINYFVYKIESHYKTEMMAQLSQKNIHYFNTNREQIISSMKKAFSEKEYQSVISQAHKYSAVKNKELKEINANAKKELDIIERAKKTKKILAELKTIPSKEYEENQNLYQQLVAINPNIQAYKKKHIYYQSKVSEQREKEKRRKELIEPQFSAWDGSHRNLTELIKKAMNDPDSYEHVETVYWDKGDYLIVMTKYRGKNAFGGKVLGMIKAKVALNGNIIQIIEQQ